MLERGVWPPLFVGSAWGAAWVARRTLVALGGAGLYAREATLGNWYLIETRIGNHARNNKGSGRGIWNGVHL